MSEKNTAPPAPERSFQQQALNALAAKDAELIACRGAKAAWKARAEKAEAENEQLLDIRNVKNTELRTLTARVDKAEADRDAARAGFRDAVEKHRVAMFEKEKAEADNARLRAALERIEKTDQVPCPECEERDEPCPCGARIAREALEKEREK